MYGVPIALVQARIITLLYGAALEQNVTSSLVVRYLLTVRRGTTSGPTETISSDSGTFIISLMAIAGSSSAGQKYLENRRYTRQRASISSSLHRKTAKDEPILLDSKEVTTAMAGETDEVKNKRLISDRATSGGVVLDENSFIVNPNDPYLKTWDVVIALLLIYTALFTPWEISFLEPDLNSLFYINILVDILFFADLCLQFVSHVH